MKLKERWEELSARHRIRSPAGGGATDETADLRAQPTLTPVTEPSEAPPTGLAVQPADAFTSMVERLAAKPTRTSKTTSAIATADRRLS